MPSSRESIRVDSPERSAELIRAVLSGEVGAARSIVVLNAAAAIWLNRPELSEAESAAVARESIDSGAAAGEARSTGRCQSNMNTQLWKFILLISLTHALVHTYELAWPSIEQEASAEFFPDNAARAKAVSGWLAGIWRLLFGGGSIVVGLLITRDTATRWLIVYLAGCGVCSLAAGASPNLLLLGTSLAGVGAFASIYHPAGLGIISQRTTPETRPMALGIHGILGSLGIAVAPFLAALWLGAGGAGAPI